MTPRRNRLMLVLLAALASGQPRPACAETTDARSLIQPPSGIGAEAYFYGSKIGHEVAGVNLFTGTLLGFHITAGGTTIQLRDQSGLFPSNPNEQIGNFALQEVRIGGRAVLIPRLAYGCPQIPCEIGRVQLFIGNQKFRLEKQPGSEPSYTAYGADKRYKAALVSSDSLRDWSLHDMETKISYAISVPPEGVVPIPHTDGAYHAFGRVTRATFSDARYVSYGYDASGRLSQIVFPDPVDHRANVPPLETVTFSYDANGMLSLVHFAKDQAKDMQFSIVNGLLERFSGAVDGRIFGYTTLPDGNPVLTSITSTKEIPTSTKSPSAGKVNIVRYLLGTVSTTSQGAFFVYAGAQVGPDPHPTWQFSYTAGQDQLEPVVTVTSARTPHNPTTLRFDPYGRGVVERQQACTIAEHPDAYFVQRYDDAPESFCPGRLLSTTIPTHGGNYYTESYHVDEFCEVTTTDYLADPGCTEQCSFSLNPDGSSTTTLVRLRNGIEASLPARRVDPMNRLEFVDYYTGEEFGVNLAGLPWRMVTDATVENPNSGVAIAFSYQIMMDPDGVPSDVVQDTIINYANSRYDCERVDRFGRLTERNVGSDPECRDDVLPDGTKKTLSTRYEYDAQNRLSRVTSDRGDVRLFYGAKGYTAATDDRVSRIELSSADGRERLSRSFTYHAAFPFQVAAMRTERTRRFQDPFTGALVERTQQPILHVYSYGAHGLLTAVQQRPADSSKSTLLETRAYDSSLRLIRRCGVNGTACERYVYHTTPTDPKFGLLDYVLDAGHLKTTVTYQACDRNGLTREIVPAAPGEPGLTRTLTEEFDSFGRLAAQRAEEGDVEVATSYRYDLAGKVEEERDYVQDELVAKRRYTYEHAGASDRLSSIVEAMTGRTTRYGYESDAPSRLLEVDVTERDPSSGVFLRTVSRETVSAFNEFDQPQTLDRFLDGIGARSYEIAYDPAGQMTSVVDRDTGAMTDYRYDSLGRLSRVTTPTSQIDLGEGLSVDGQRLLRITIERELAAEPPPATPPPLYETLQLDELDHLGRTVQTSHHSRAVGGPTCVELMTDQLAYTPAGHLRQVIRAYAPWEDHPASQETFAYAYDLLGNLTSATHEGASLYSADGFDGLGRPRASGTNPERLYTYGYGPFETAFDTLDPLGNSERWELSVEDVAAGELRYTTIKTPASGRESITLQTTVDLKGQITGYEGWRTAADGSSDRGANSLVWQYDLSSGRLMSIEGRWDGVASAMRFLDYDAYGRPQTEVTSHPDGTELFRMSKRFDTQGRVEQLIYPDGVHRASYVRNALGEVDTAEFYRGDELLTRSRYRRHGPTLYQAEHQLPGSRKVVRTLSYDPIRPLLSGIRDEKVSPTGARTAFSTVALRYDEKLRLIDYHDSGARSDHERFGYTAHHGLERYSSEAQQISRTYGHQVDGGLFAIQGALDAASRATSKFQYDAFGNPVAEIGDGSQGRRFQWSLAAGLRNILDADGAPIAEFIRDPLGRTIQIETPAGATTYIRDDFGRVYGEKREATNTEVFTFYVEDTPVTSSMKLSDGTWKVRAHVTQPFNNTTNYFVTNGSVAPVIYADLYPSSRWIQSADWELDRYPSLGVHGIPFREDLKLAIAHWREVDERTSAFLNPDPLGRQDSDNQYQYASGGREQLGITPLFFTDPTGFCTQASSGSKSCSGGLPGMFVKGLADLIEEIYNDITGRIVPDIEQDYQDGGIPGVLDGALESLPPYMPGGGGAFRLPKLGPKPGISPIGGPRLGPPKSSLLIPPAAPSKNPNFGGQKPPKKPPKNPTNWWSEEDGWDPRYPPYPPEPPPSSPQEPWWKRWWPFGGGGGGGGGSGGSGGGGGGGGPAG